MQDIMYSIGDLPERFWKEEQWNKVNMYLHTNPNKLHSVLPPYKVYDLILVRNVLHSHEKKMKKLFHQYSNVIRELLQIDDHH